MLLKKPSALTRRAVLGGSGSPLLLLLVLSAIWQGAAGLLSHVDAHRWDRATRGSVLTGPVPTAVLMGMATVTPLKP